MTLVQYRLAYAELDYKLSNSDRGRNLFFCALSRDLIWISYISYSKCARRPSLPDKVAGAWSWPYTYIWYVQCFRIISNNTTNFFQTVAHRYDLELKVSYPRSSLASQVSYLGTFAYWRKGLLASSCLNVPLSGHVYLLGSYWTGFRDIRFWGFYENLWRKIEILVKSGKKSDIYVNT